MKDHLGNTRMVLTEEQQTDAYPVASLEDATIATERLYYGNLDSGRVNKNTVPGYPNDTYTTPNNYIQQLSGSTGAYKIGASITIKVMAGDTVNIRASSWYRQNGTTPGSPNSPLASLVVGLASGLTGSDPGHYIQGQLQQPGVLDPGITSFLSVVNSDYNANTSKPKAYLNWILFDEQFHPVITNDGKNSGFDRVGSDTILKTHIIPGQVMTKSGYLFVYVSNETPNINVYFDNLQLTHMRGRIVEETHYYPFGLTMAGISYQEIGKPENKYRYNKGSELQNKEFSDGSGLEMYETKLRELDPQLGRWWQMDSKPDYAQSLYSAMGNNPILYNDPLGDSIPKDELERLYQQGILVHKNLGGDQTGLIRNATDEEFKENPLGAVGKNIVHLLADLVGLNTVDNISAEIRQEYNNGTLNTGDVVLAIAGVGLATTRGEGGEVVVNKGPVQPYEVGMTADLWRRSVPGDDLSIHHAPQGKPAGQLIEGYEYKNAPGIALPKAEHSDIPTLKRENTAGTPRQQLAKDIRDLRKYTNAPNSSLQQLIDLNKFIWPELYNKKQ